MLYVEIAVCFLLGAAIAAVFGFVFNLRTKGMFRLLVNSLAGSLLLLVLSLSGLVVLPLNPFNALLTGVLGLPALALIAAVTFFLCFLRLYKHRAKPIFMPLSLTRGSGFAAPDYLTADGVYNILLTEGVYAFALFTKGTFIWAKQGT